MEEFDALIEKICNSSSSAETRTYSERRLLDILSDRHSWQLYTSLLFQANDNVCFFICIGLQRLVWRHWSEFSNEEKQQLNQTIIQTLLTKQNMQHFAKSKLEQLLAIICANGCSLEPVLSLLVAADQPNAIIGLSAMRTVLDFVLSDDPKLVPEHKSTVLTATQELLTPMTNLACSACSLALQVQNEAHLSLMTVSLELLKILAGKLQIGPHISKDVVSLLFTVAELGADSKSVFHSSALSSIEVLTEVMSKRYIPPSGAVATISPTSMHYHSTSFHGTLKKDFGSSGTSSIDMLLDIVVRSVSLLKKYRLGGSVEDSPLVLSLLEFVSVFAESHLERCISMSAVASQGGDASGGTPALLTQSISLFFEELVSMTTVSMEPHILSKIVSVWNRVMGLETVKEMLMCRPPICLSIVSHLLQSCLVQTNAHLREDKDELVEDMRVEGISDPHIKEILSHLGGGAAAGGAAGGEGGGAKGGEVLSAEESGYVGTTLLSDSSALFVELVSCPEVLQWLNQTTAQLLAQNIAVLSGGPKADARSCAAIDICFIVRLLPMISANKNEVILQLSNLAVQLMEARMHSYGKELLALEVSCGLIAGQILQSNFVSVQLQQGGNAAPTTMVSLFAIILRGLAAVCDVYISPSPHPLIMSVCVLLNQAIVAYADLLDQEGATKSSVLLALNVLLEKGKDLPLEVYALLMCAHDYLDPHTVSTSLVQQCADLASALEINCNNNAGNDKAQITAVIRVCGAMDALARHHSLSKPQRRQCLISHFTHLQSILGPFMSVLLRQILQSCANGSSASSSAGSLSSSVQAANIVVSLASALLQSLGKKTFGKVASDVLAICVDFAENAGSSGVLFEGSGLVLTKQFLELSKVLAESTAASSATASSQAMVTHRLLVFVSSKLGDERVCAELLQPTLKAGIVAIGCYWQKSQKPSFSPAQASLNSSIVNGSNADPSGESSGINVQPIAALLTQLCVGSLGPTVPPQDTLTALEGLISLGEQHQLFAVGWFQSQSWGSLLTPCLRAVLLRIHNMHRDTIETLLIALAKAGATSYIGAAGSSNNSSGGSSVSEAKRVKFQEFWLNIIGREVVSVASEFNCGESANQLVFSVVTAYSNSSSGNGSVPSSSHSLSIISGSNGSSGGGNNGSPSYQGPASLDMRVFIDKVIGPVSAQIARGM